MSKRDFVSNFVEKGWGAEEAQEMADKLENYCKKAFSEGKTIDGDDIRDIVGKCILEGNPSNWRTKYAQMQDSGIAFESRKKHGWEKGSFMFLGEEDSYRIADEQPKGTRVTRIEFLIDEDTGEFDTAAAVKMFMENGWSGINAGLLVAEAECVMAKYRKLYTKGDKPEKLLRKEFREELERVISAGIDKQYADKPNEKPEIFSETELKIARLKDRALAEMVAKGWELEKAMRLLDNLENLAKSFEGKDEPTLKDVIKNGLEALAQITKPPTKTRYMAMLLWSDKGTVDCAYSKDGETKEEMLERMKQYGEYTVVGRVEEREVPI